MTDRAIKNASPREKEYFLTDSDGLRLRVSPTGVKTFQMRYTFYGKRKIVTIGDYPFISLASARNKVIEYKTKLANGIDPQAALMQEKLEASKTDEGQIHLVIEEWLLIRTHKVSRKTLIRDRGLIEHHFLPHFARYDTKKEIVSSLHIRDIHHSQISKIIMQLQLRIPEGAKRLLAHCYNIWQFALSRGLAEFNIIANIDKKTILLPKSDRHYAKITDRVVLGELMRAIDSYPNSIIIKCALQFVAIIPLRASNLASLKWEYIDFESKTLTIPRGNMKVKSNHLTDFTLPLPRQAIEILQEIKQFTGWGKLVFHASTKIHSPLVMESLNKALRSMGFADEKRGRKQTIHSFRGTFRSLCNTYQSEHNASFEIKEAVLDHKVGNRVTEAYLYKVEYVEQIRPLLQWWADFLDRVREE